MSGCEGGGAGRKFVFQYLTVCIWYVYAACLTGDDSRFLDGPAWQKFLSNWDQLAEGLDENGDVVYRDENGEIIKFIMLFGGADLEKLCIGWGLKSYNDVDEMCMCCKANRNLAERPYTNLHENSEWRETCPMPNDVAKSC